jgi:glycerate kinase
VTRPMKIVVAPDKFKGCLSAGDIATAIAAGIRRVLPDAQIDQCPIADGGEGIVDALVSATNGRIETRRVVGPLPDMRVDARFGILGDGATAVVEMSAACGLALLPLEERNPFRTTTFGAGQLLLEATKLNVKEIILGIGGSATVDAGIGCLQACGQPVILDQIGPADTNEPLVGEDLHHVVLIKHARGSPLDRVKITVACDVTNPLFGPNGAARIFGPQKGATPEQVEELDHLLKRLAERCGKLDEAHAPGAGAAGGLGFAMLAFSGATLRPGFEIVADAVKLRDRLYGADLCITGEGRLDASSLSGKAAVSVARLCLQMGVRCAAIVGSADAGIAQDLFDPIKVVQTAGMPPNDALNRAAELIADRAAELIG